MKKIEEKRIKNIVIGCGAAGLATALRLYRLGETDTAIVTENLYSGTSRNTGSDKQTYYKLSLAGGDADSVQSMASDLFSGGAVDGDLALCEAALSTRGFYNLVELGVPFPCNQYGEYMGYKTDHDHGRRATSAGPYTSKLMTEALEKEIKREKIRILDHMQAIRLLVKDNRIYGILCLSTEDDTFQIIWAENVVLATGGPAGMYHDSVYPSSQLGASGMAFYAGVTGKNLTEWQFGMASIRPRWNVSGTYMQVLPRFVSVSQGGTDEREFLFDYIEDRNKLLSLIFLKGYQWPFDTAKAMDGSSLIDILVYRETILRGRRVFLDYTKNMGNRSVDFTHLSSEASQYLKNAGADFGTPIERLQKMNQPAVDFYLEHGVDLHKDMLEISICAQHNNGGLSTDANWETNIRGLYAAGEVNGTHGVTRPGGTALNAGQVAAVRISEAIVLKSGISENTERTNAVFDQLRKSCEEYTLLPEKANGCKTASELWQEFSKDMSAVGGMIRNLTDIKAQLDKINDVISNYTQIIKKPDAKGLSLFFRLIDMLYSQKVYLFAMLNYIQEGHQSRGSALYTDCNGQKPFDDLPEIFRFKTDQGLHRDKIQEVQLQNDGDMTAMWRNVRPIPRPDYFFENAWREYRLKNHIN